MAWGHRAGDRRSVRMSTFSMFGPFVFLRVYRVPNPSPRTSAHFGCIRKTLPRRLHLLIPKTRSMTEDSGITPPGRAARGEDCIGARPKSVGRDLSACKRSEIQAIVRRRHDLGPFLEI